MRLRLPFDGVYPVMQTFGVRPEVYAKFGLPGHEGLDWGMPSGTPIKAVDDGQVGLASDKGAYRLHYRIVHSWGESVYAHLSKLLVTQGQRVGKGQVIGLSGSTGNSTGPHLHFGLRVAPFFRDSKRDQYQGFCNPAPYFRPERFVMGPHIHGGDGSMIPLLRQWQPPAVTILDPSKDFVAELATACPDTKIVGRIYKPDSEVSDRIKANPADAAAWMDEAVLTHPAFADGHVTYWQIANEVCQGDWSSYSMLDSCMNEWMTKAKNAYHCGLFAFSVGNPDTPGNDSNWWKLITPTLRRATKEGHVLLIHEYGTGDGLDGPQAKGGADWLAQRYVRQVRPYLQARDVQIIVSEFGYDGLLIGPHPAGWQTSGKSAETYAGELVAMGENYARYRDQIMGVCVYTLGARNEWSSYNIDGEVAGLLAKEAEEQRTENGGAEDGGTGNGDLLAAAFAEAKRHERISLDPGGALQKAMVEAGCAPTSGEFGFSYENIGYVAQWGEHVSRKEQPRLYFCEVGKWDEIREEVEA